MIVKVTEAEIEARNKMNEEKQKTFKQRLADMGLTMWYRDLAHCYYPIIGKNVLLVIINDCIIMSMVEVFYVILSIQGFD